MSGQSGLFSILFSQSQLFYCECLAFYAQIPHFGFIFKPKTTVTDSKFIRKVEERTAELVDSAELPDLFFETLFHLNDAFGVSGFDFTTSADLEKQIRVLESEILRFASRRFKREFEDWDALQRHFGDYIRSEASDLLRTAPSELREQLSREWSADEMSETGGVPRYLSASLYLNERPSAGKMILPHAAISAVTGVMVIFSSAILGFFLEMVSGDILMKNQRDEFERGLWFSLLMNASVGVEMNDPEPIIRYYRSVCERMDEFTRNFGTMNSRKKQAESRLKELRRQNTDTERNLKILRRDIDWWVREHVPVMVSPEGLEAVRSACDHPDQVKFVEAVLDALRAETKLPTDPYRKRARAAGAEIEKTIQSEVLAERMSELIFTLIEEKRFDRLSGAFDPDDFADASGWATEWNELTERHERLKTDIGSTSNELPELKSALIETRLKIRREKEHWPGFADHYKKRL